MKMMKVNGTALVQRSSVVSLSNSVSQSCVSFRIIRPLNHWGTLWPMGSWPQKKISLRSSQKESSGDKSRFYLFGATACLKKKMMCSIIFKSYQSFTRPSPTTRLPFFRIEIHEPVKPGSDQMTDCKRLVAKRMPWAALRSRWFLERMTH